MSARSYSLDAWRRFKEGHRCESSNPPSQSLADIPADAEMDEGIVFGCWNGERFVSWEKWRATTPIQREAVTEPLISPHAQSLTATCVGTQIWLVRDGDRWLMYAGTRASRRKDFASPFLEHARRTAEAWYGAPERGWLTGTTK